MSENEEKLGFALVDILDNWENIFKNLEGGKKYNKILKNETRYENSYLRFFLSIANLKNYS
jgi:hypothetical protein